ncbi:MBL fold metallo-hydrolase [Caenispirillum salinarum]|uniref:MBL fold metallo-hydrolase n=1 Tax=Caenispirillum salinarum TaxID=859058 RepID=UPI00384C69A5
MTGLRNTIIGAALAAGVLLTTPAAALDVEEVAEGVYALVGPLEQRSPENLGNNATFGAIVTDDGVVLIDSGGSAAGAEEIADAVATVTDKPVTTVINTGGQDHRWFGNAWFQTRGATVIASEAAVADQRDRSDAQYATMRRLIGEDVIAGTDLSHADATFSDTLETTVGGVPLVLHHAGPAHTPGDAFVWLPEQRVLFSGDIVYMDRMLGVGPQSDSRSWLEAFDALAAHDPAVIVPGHGAPGDLAKATRQTRDYLAHLREQVGTVLEEGGDANAAVAVDQSDWSHLAVADEIGGRNAQQVYMQMEWE